MNRKCKRKVIAGYVTQACLQIVKMSGNFSKPDVVSWRKSQETYYNLLVFQQFT